jgi:predicted nucleic acid-binding protein
VISLSRELDISTYDASYIEIASRLGLALVTADRRRASAATEAGLAVIEPTSGE